MDTGKMTLAWALYVFSSMSTGSMWETAVLKSYPAVTCTGTGLPTWGRIRTWAAAGCRVNTTR